MTKELWINLPVKDVNTSVAFFTSIGFELNPHQPVTPVMASLMIGDKKIILMLFEEKMFAGFTQQPLTDTQKSTEVLFSIDAQSREEVDELAKKAAAAGGNVFAKPAESQGWMYGCAFSDPDGHRWNVLYMDFSRMPK